MTTTASDPRPQPPSPLRRPAYRRLMIGWFATNLGDSALYLVLAIWVRELTGSDAAGALVFLFLGLPALLAPWAGQLADRVHRRPLLIVTNLATAGVVLALLLVQGPQQVWLIYAVTFGYGLSAYLTSAAQSGMLRDLLPDDEIGSANGIFTSIDNGMRIVSPPLGAGLYVLAGPWAVVAVSVAGYLVMALMLLTVRIEESAPEPRAAGVGYWHEVSAGFRALLADPLLRLLTIAAAVGFGLTGILNATIFPLIEHGLQAGPAALGPAQAIQGVAALGGGLLSAMVLRRLGERRLFAWGMTLVAVGSFAAFALVQWPMPEEWMRWIGIALVQWPIGFGVPWVVVGLSTLRMRLVPSRLQGRTSAAMNVSINVPQMIMLAIGTGAMVLIDFRWLLLAAAIGIAGAAIAVWAWRSPNEDAADASAHDGRPTSG
ncbi:MFS transporter [Agrococcus sp. ARC_14]|uniref:MFS transporter n=1 Tax=Agrococcus sp. ARC_14 TaxID=2919927 RepID=UPI001F064457|nr:MFS transporter [Agrococcus sp. ARC_14]MCH1884019.1 MFS transporter [Agrococcus sp. ARC_14]